jgi:hypothetical protein
METLAAIVFIVLCVCLVVKLSARRSQKQKVWMLLGFTEEREGYALTEGYILKRKPHLKPNSIIMYRPHQARFQGNTKPPVVLDLKTSKYDKKRNSLTAQVRSPNLKNKRYW